MYAKAIAPLTQLVPTRLAGDVSSETGLGFGPFERALLATVRKRYLFIAALMTFGTSCDWVSTPTCVAMPKYH